MPIRLRLGLALAAALAPVLILSGLQSTLEYQRENRARRAELAGAAERSAATARARIAAGEVLLETLAPASIGFQCAPRLAEIRDRIPGYANLIRFDAIGRVACTAGTAPADPQRRDRPWFRALMSGEPISISSDAGAAYADEPALLASVRAEDQQGRFAGALTAVITLASLRPQTLDRSLPDRSDVAVTDAAGRLLSTTKASAFPPDIRAHLQGAARTGQALWFGADRSGASRVFSSAPLVGRDVYVVLSAPSEGLLSWARVNPVSAVVLPLLAFLLPLLAVIVVAERGVVRWIAYLRRIAAIYARGRYSVHPWRAEAAPPEIRTLATTLDAMARTIAARDADLNATLAQKEDLLREIHHRVKNNLQVISSLLNLQQRALSDAAARAALSDSRQRIGALALIYRALYEGPDLKQVNLRDFLDDLIAQTIVGDAAQSAPIRTELEIDPLVIDADRLAPLALFAVEAITNAKKHGLERAGGRLCVKLRVGENEATLTISDSGMAGAVPTVGQGVGRTLMTAFARQLRGEVAFAANDDGGLTARLTFPARPPGADRKIAEEQTGK
jgi:two-component sensor histidine kinase